MRHFVIYALIIVIGASINSCSSASEKDYISEIEQLRTDKNLIYSDSIKSPLNPAHISEFNGLDYFKIDPEFKIEGVLELTPDEQPFKMPTSTDRLPIYRKYGNFRFKIKDEHFSLSVYQNMDFIDDTLRNKYLFIPFQDLTSSKESYGGGRYIDILIPETEKVVVDFNLAYNPYCAYFDRWSCVIPPPENFLKARITAGEKKFHLAEH